MLRRLLNKLENQQTDGLFSYTIVVADNDYEQSAERVVEAFSSSSQISVTYCAEPQQNIALVRNKALQHAAGDLVAFIDDDEFPEDRWLLELLKTMAKYEADGVLGPVKPYFESEPPLWMKKGKFFERPDHPTGYKLFWSESRTGNVLFRKYILNGPELPFDPQFNTAGEDVDFFRRVMARGHVFVWCSEAAVYEVVPSSRCTSRYLLRRALLRGSNFSKHPTHRIRNAARSLIAVPSYTVALPFLAILGKHMFIKYLIKLFDHAARLCAYLGLHLVTEREA
jgi:succinoglycan biosynthesis protein ExoM